MEWTQRTQEVRVEEELQGVLDAVNGGDLSRRIDLIQKSGFFEALGAGVNRLAESLVEIVSRVKSGGREIALGAEEITAGNSNLSLRTEEQASPRGDRLLHGRDDLHGQAECRQREPGKPARDGRARTGRQGRRAWWIRPCAP